LLFFLQSLALGVAGRAVVVDAASVGLERSPNCFGSSKSDVPSAPTHCPFSEHMAICGGGCGPGDHPVAIRDAAKPLTLATARRSPLHIADDGANVSPSPLRLPPPRGPPRFS
jgi:hypothetical protein